MKLERLLISMIALVICLTAICHPSVAQTVKLYQQMSASEQAAFSAEQARQIARRMSGTKYQFTPSFETEIQKSLDAYVQRLGNKSDHLGKTDPRLILERAQPLAPILIGVFNAHDVSPLIGLYVPWIESEYTNIQSPNAMGAMGMFQFLPQTGRRFGLGPADLINVEKSADAAARYIAHNLKRFQQDPMKEALALLAYNRGESTVEHDVALLVNDQNNVCSICALTDQRDQLNATFRDQNVHYVPQFFAAAIMGENPQAFGLQLQALSSYETKH